MSKEVVSSDFKYVEGLRKSKRTLDQNTWIWVIAFLVAALFLLIGFFDFTADWQRIRTSGNYVHTYTSRNGEEDVRTYVPVFGQVFVRKPQGGFLPENIGLSIHDWIVLAMIVLTGIPAILIYQRENRRLTQIDDNLPFLLREIADAQRIGMQLPRAIAEAAKRNYGPLTPELKKMAAKVSWGIPFRDAMMAFRESVSTPLSRQATILVLEAERSGGELEKIFDSAKDYVEELLAIKQERESSIKPYIYIVFISYIIFAVVIYVLFSTFFAPFGATEVTTTTGQEGVIPVPIYAFQVYFLYLLISQAFFSGLVAGKMGHGSIKVGLLYSTFLMVVGLFVQKFLIEPTVARVIRESQGS